VFVERTQAKGGAVAAHQVHATLAQLMKGILYPGSNVFFAVRECANLSGMSSRGASKGADD